MCFIWCHIVCFRLFHFSQKEYIFVVVVVDVASHRLKFNLKIRLERVLANCEATDEYIRNIQENTAENEQRICELDRSVSEALTALCNAAASEISQMTVAGIESDDDEELLTNFVNQKRRERRQGCCYAWSYRLKAKIFFRSNHISKLLSLHLRFGFISNIVQLKCHFIIIFCFVLYFD